MAMKKGSCKRVQRAGSTVCLCRLKNGKVKFSSKCGSKKAAKKKTTKKRARKR